MPSEAWARWLGSNETQSFCCGLLVVQSASATPSTSLMAAASAASAGSGDGAAVAGAAVTGPVVDVGAFVADKGAAPAVLAFAPGTLTGPGRAAAGIEIDVEVGYGAAPANVPETLRQALLLLVAHWYENRGLIAIGRSVAVLPLPIAALIAPYRVLSL